MFAKFFGKGKESTASTSAAGSNTRSFNFSVDHDAKGQLNPQTRQFALKHVSKLPEVKRSVSPNSRDRVAEKIVSAVEKGAGSAEGVTVTVPLSVVNSGGQLSLSMADSQGKTSEVKVSF